MEKLFAVCFFMTFVCVIHVISSVEVLSLSEAKERMLSRHVRETNDGDAGTATFGPGVFGNDTLTFKTECVRMEVDAVKVWIRNASSVDYSVYEDLTNETFTVSGDCSAGNSTNGTNSLTILMKEPHVQKNITSLNITFLFGRDNFEWEINNVSLELGYNGKEWKGHLETQDIHLGAKNYYLCQNSYPFRSMNTANTTGTAAVMFPSIILQPFQSKNETMNSTWIGEVEPCEYAFSIALWMSVCTGIIMTLILALGISMLATIKTPDRFDDPKTSKLLSVPAE